jgi:predicted ester cyclase
MSNLEANKAIALQLIEVFNSRQLDLLEDVLHPDFRGCGISAFMPDNPEVGPSARRNLYEMFLQAIPDARGEVLGLVAEGDKVVLHDRFGGTHRGEFLGRPGTGNRIEWMAIHIYTIRDGKIIEDAYMRDELAIMQQLGLAPQEGGGVGGRGWQGAKLRFQSSTKPLPRLGAGQLFNLSSAYTWILRGRTGNRGKRMTSAEQSTFPLFVLRPILISAHA